MNVILSNAIKKYTIEIVDGNKVLLTMFFLNKTKTTQIFTYSEAVIKELTTIRDQIDLKNNKNKNIIKDLINKINQTKSSN